MASMDDSDADVRAWQSERETDLDGLDISV